MLEDKIARWVSTLYQMLKFRIHADLEGEIHVDLGPNQNYLAISTKTNQIYNYDNTTSIQFSLKIQ